MYVKQGSEDAMHPPRILVARPEYTELRATPSICCDQFEECQ